MKTFQKLSAASVATLFCLFLMAGFVSCNEGQEAFAEPEIYPEDGLITMTRTLDVATTRAVAGVANVTVVYNTKTETLVSYTPSPALLDAVQMTPAQLDDFLRQEMGPAYFLDDVSAQQAQGPFSQCYEKCMLLPPNYGRGNCRLACWVDMFERTVKEVAKLINIKI